jgi:hypothetical protein
VVQYEYVSVGGVLDGSAIGGRVEGWMPGHMVRLGITATDETTDTADLQVIAGDVHLRFSEGSYLEAEVAKSEGQGFGRSFSSDGGFTWVPIAGSGTTTRAQAVWVDGNLVLADLAPCMAGALTAFYEAKEKGFSTLSEDVTDDQTEWGLGFEVAVSDRLDVSLSYEDSDSDSDSGTKRSQGTADLSYKINPDLTLDVGLAHLDQNQPGEITETGKRTDLGFKLTRALSDDQSIYVFGQGTLDRQGTIRRNDRLGVGGRFNLSANVAVEAEVSDGTNGFGGRALLDYRPDDTSRYYLGYELDPNRDIAGTTANGTHQGTIIAGGERPVNDFVSYFGENDYDVFGRRQSLISAYGVTYTPSALWSYTANIETGVVRDDNDGNFEPHSTWLWRQIRQLRWC